MTLVLAQIQADSDNVTNAMGCIPSENPMKVQLIGLLQTVQYIKLPVVMFYTYLYLYNIARFSIG